MPLLNGFIGEFTILRGVFEVSWQWAAWGSFGVILGAAYLLWLYQRVMFGSVTNPANEHLPDLNAREYATLIPLVVLAFWIGIYPAPLFKVAEAAGASPGGARASGILRGHAFAGREGCGRSGTTPAPAMASPAGAQAEVK